jgi:hypothetical protein
LAGLPAQAEAEYYVVMMADMGLKPAQKRRSMILTPLSVVN